jgi:hypothetical protein
MDQLDLLPVGKHQRPTVSGHRTVPRRPRELRGPRASLARGANGHPGVRGDGAEGITGWRLYPCHRGRAGVVSNPGSGRVGGLLLLESEHQRHDLGKGPPPA